MSGLLCYLSILIGIWIFTDQVDAQVDSFNFTDTDFHVRGKRSMFLRNRPGRIDPQCRICGVSATATLARVINGVPVKPRWKYPWVVPTTVRNNKKFSCGGALISRDFVLTAAHCIRDPRFVNSRRCIYRGRSVSCFLQPHEINMAIMGESHNRPIVLVKASQIFMHPQYDYWKDLNDVALIRLSRPIPQCNKYISPICLPTKPMSKRNQQVVVAGWGRYLQNSKANEGPQVLREGRVLEVDPTRCMRSNNLERRPEKIYCTVGQAAQNQSSCQGDSGTSVFSSFFGVFYSLGVTSIHTDGDKCPIDGTVSFANTFGYMDFILSIVRQLPQPPPSSRRPENVGKTGQYI